jgi:hypothetical protein
MTSLTALRSVVHARVCTAARATNLSVGRREEAHPLSATEESHA